MIHHMIMTADEAIEKLKSGNMRYLLMNSNSGNVSAALRKFTYEHGQHPHAIIVTCSDSRVIPETIFSAGLGELFVIRVAGNVIDDHQLGSIEYAAGHLGSPVVVVLGHTHCGAVDAAINSDPEGYIKFITDEKEERKMAGDRMMRYIVPFYFDGAYEEVCRKLSEASDEWEL